MHHSLTANKEKIKVTEQPKVESKAEEPKFISIKDVIKVDMRIGEIVECEIVEGSEKLLKSQVDFGELGKRQIFSGIRKHYSPEDLIGTQGVFIVNLKPRKMMGMMSEGMMLFAAGEEDALNKLMPDNKAINGTKIQ